MNGNKEVSRPWWVPDVQGFVIGTVMLYAGVVLFYRMTHPAEIDDKLLDMMLTILYGTALVGVLNFVVGSSRSSQAKDENQAKVAEELAKKVPGGGAGDVMRAAIAAAPAAAAAAAPPAAEIAAPPAVNEIAPPIIKEAVAEAMAEHDSRRVVSWWTRMTNDETAAIIDAGKTDSRVADIILAAKDSKARPDDLAYLVSVGLLTQERADEIKGA